MYYLLLEREAELKVQLESTDKIVQVRMPNGASVPARIWEGVTESGIPVHAYMITRIAAPEQWPDLREFEQELQEHRKPSPDIEALPLSLIL